MILTVSLGGMQKKTWILPCLCVTMLSNINGRGKEPKRGNLTTGNFFIKSFKKFDNMGMFSKKDNLMPGNVFS